MEATNNDFLLEPPVKLSFFQIFIQKANATEKKLIIFICIIFAMSSSMILGIPIVFQDPRLICLPENEVCTEEIACSQEYIIDMDNGPKSFTAEFGLICDKKPEKAFAITLSFVGVFIGCLMSTFIMVLARRRKLCLSLLGILLGAALLGMRFSVDSFFIISILICLCTFCFMYINTFSYLFIGENFKGELAGFVTIIYSVTWACIGIFYAIFAYLIRADWRIFVITTGIISLFGGIGLFLINPERKLQKQTSGDPEIEELNDEKEEPENMGMLSYFRDMWPNVQIRVNFIVYVLFWSLCTLVYSAILIELGSVGGNLFANICLCSILEIVAAIMAGSLTERYSCSTILKFLITFLAIFLTVFFLSPVNLGTADPLTMFLFLLSMFLAKINNDTLNLVTYLYLPKVFTDKYVGFWMLCSRFFSRFLGLFIPTIGFTMRSFGLHPFCFYGICWIVCRILFSFTQEVQVEGIDDLLNEMNVNMTERLSVLTGSFSNGTLLHDENLKNIKVEGVPLSMIRRFKQDPTSFKGSQLMRIRDTMMRRSKISFAANSKLSALVEMKDINQDQS